ADTAAGERAVLAALGWDRGDTIRLATLRGGRLGVLGAVGGACIAVALSPLFPVGIGRIADPDVGWHADVLVLAGGMVATVACVTMLTVVTAARSAATARARGLRARGEARVLRGRGARAIVGVAFTRSERAFGSRLSIVSLVAVTALLVATLLTLASFDNLSHHRELAGATWDAAVSPSWNVDGRHADAALARVRAIPGVAAATT